MRVKSLEFIRKKADLTEYRMAAMLGISQTNYQQIVAGTIKKPSSKVAIAALNIARDYTNIGLEKAVEMISADLKISADVIQETYKGNKKNKGMSKK